MMTKLQWSTGYSTNSARKQQIPPQLANMFTPARQYVKDRLNSSGLGENDISLLPSSCKFLRLSWQAFFWHVIRSIRILYFRGSLSRACGWQQEWRRCKYTSRPKIDRFDPDYDPGKKLEDYLVLATCLKESERLKEGHSEWCEKLEDYLSQSIFPDGKVFSLDETDGMLSDANPHVRSIR